MQVSRFWSPLAWPDLLCAHKHRTRQQTVGHVAVAFGMALICWHPRFISAHLSAVADIWMRLANPPDRLDANLMVLMLLLVVLCLQLLLLAAYAWTVRNRNLQSSSSQEVSWVQNDIQDMLGAVTVLSNKQGCRLEPLLWRLQILPPLLQTSHVRQGSRASRGAVPHQVRAS